MHSFTATRRPVDEWARSSYFSTPPNGCEWISVLGGDTGYLGTVRWGVGGGGVGVGSNLADDFRDVIAASRFMCLTSHKLMYRAFDVELLFWCLFCLHCSELFFVFFVVVLVCIL